MLFLFFHFFSFLSFLYFFFTFFIFLYFFHFFFLSFAFLRRKKFLCSFFFTSFELNLLSKESFFKECNKSKLLQEDKLHGIVSREALNSVELKKEEKKWSFIYWWMNGDENDLYYWNSNSIIEVQFHEIFCKNSVLMQEEYQSIY